MKKPVKQAQKTDTRTQLDKWGNIKNGKTVLHTSGLLYAYEQFVRHLFIQGDIPDDISELYETAARTMLRHEEIRRKKFLRNQQARRQRIWVKQQREKQLAKKRKIQALKNQRDAERKRVAAAKQREIEEHLKLA